MRPFKFFDRNVIFNITSGHSYLNPYQRRYLGCERGVIQWMDQPVGRIFYMEPTRLQTQPGEIPQINIELQSQTITVESRRINSWSQFLEQNRNNIIFVYQVISLVDGTIYNNRNVDLIPDDVQLVVRCSIKVDE